MNGLLDFLQGASNAAASNVTAPVDMINWLLQKAGLPVSQAPVGGSAWAEQKGLTKKPQNALLGMAGETAGLLSPVVAAAKAPQIAKGLLQMGENAAAPRTMSAGLFGGQRGAIDAGGGVNAKELREEILSQYRRLSQEDPYAYFGVRVMPAEQSAAVGKRLPRSSKWIDGRPLSTKLPGTAVFELRQHTAEDAINHALSYNLGTSGQKVAIVKGGELAKNTMPERHSALIKRPEVIAVYDRPGDLAQVFRVNELLKVLGD